MQNSIPEQSMSYDASKQSNNIPPLQRQENISDEKTKTILEDIDTIFLVMPPDDIDANLIAFIHGGHHKKFYELNARRTTLLNSFSMKIAPLTAVNILKSIEGSKLAEYTPFEARRKASEIYRKLDSALRAEMIAPEFPVQKTLNLVNLVKAIPDKMQANYTSGNLEELSQFIAKRDRLSIEEMYWSRIFGGYGLINRPKSEEILAIAGENKNLKISSKMKSIIISRLLYKGDAENIHKDLIGLGKHIEKIEEFTNNQGFRNLFGKRWAGLSTSIDGIDEFLLLRSQFQEELAGIPGNSATIEGIFQMDRSARLSFPADMTALKRGVDFAFDEKIIQSKDISMEDVLAARQKASVVANIDSRDLLDSSQPLIKALSSASDIADIDNQIKNFLVSHSLSDEITPEHIVRVKAYVDAVVNSSLPEKIKNGLLSIQFKDVLSSDELRPYREEGVTNTQKKLSFFRRMISFRKRK